jgi:phospholipid/cholesterol/gamma-HCH transport system substrate-binding protein
LKNKKNIIIGLVISISVAILLWGLSYLKGKNFLKDDYYYYVVYDKIDGLEVSSPVLINGLKVGKIREIKFISGTRGKLAVKFDLENNFKVPDSTVAQIFSLDLMGTKGVQLFIGNSKKIHKIGDTLISSLELDLKNSVSAQMLPLKLKAEGLMLSIDSVLMVIQYIFNQSTRENLTKAFASIKETLHNLESTSKNLDTIVKTERGRLALIFLNIESITTNLRNNGDKISNIINNFSTLSDTIVKSQFTHAIVNANKILNMTYSIIDKINKGQGTIGMLVNNDTLYRHIEKTANELDKLIYDIRINPKRYVHFSLIDKGKTYSVNDKGDLNKMKKKDRKNLNSESWDNKIIFKIQIKSANNQIPQNSSEFMNYKDNEIEELFLDGKYKYTVGKSYSYEEIVKLQNQIKSIFPDAFVVAFKNGIQISVSEAIAN